MVLIILVLAILSLDFALESFAIPTDCALWRNTFSKSTNPNSTLPLGLVLCEVGDFSCIIFTCLLTDPIELLLIIVVPLIGLYSLVCCCIACVSIICVPLLYSFTRSKEPEGPVTLSSTGRRLNMSYENSIMSGTQMSGSVNRDFPMSDVQSSSNRRSNSSSVILYESVKIGSTLSTSTRYQTIHENPTNVPKVTSYCEVNSMSPTSTTGLVMENENADRRDLSYHEKSSIYEEVSEIYKAYEQGWDLSREEELVYQYASCNTVINDFKTATIVLSCSERDKVGNNYDYVFNQVPDSSLGQINYFKQSTGFKIPSKNLSTIYDDMSESNFREINRKTLTLNDKLSHSQFAVIFKGIWSSNYGDVPVAIKVVNDTNNNEETICVLREATVMGQFDHPNILKLFGVVTLGKPYMIITELQKDQLDYFLYKLNRSPVENSKFPNLLHKFCIEICSGMEYLSGLKFIHRDLAARNISLTLNLSCRIADFGMCCEIRNEQEYYRSSGIFIPVRWAAPESVFYQRYSNKSDVWSFGMTMYEIWGMGLKPWYELETEDVVDTLVRHSLPTPPTGCPRSVYKLMIDIWNPDPENRPNFSDLKSQLKAVRLSNVVETDPMHLAGNDPSLTKDLYLELQNKYSMQ